VTPPAGLNGASGGLGGSGAFGSSPFGGGSPFGTSGASGASGASGQTDPSGQPGLGLQTGSFKGFTPFGQSEGGELGELTGLPIAGVKSKCKDRPFRKYKEKTSYSEWVFTIFDLDPKAQPAVTPQNTNPGGTPAPTPAKTIPLNNP
jgi:hypothetical protein